MAKQVASNETGTTDKIDWGSVSDTFHLYVQFISSGDVKIEATPNEGTDWIPLNNGTVSQTSVVALDSSPSEFRLVAQNGAEFNAWVE